MSVRPDNRLEDGQMVTVVCGGCAGAVDARKSSWQQTSIQWRKATVAACVERRGWTPEPGNRGAVFPGCHALVESVAEAARRGELPVQDDDPLKTNPEAHEAHSEEHA